MASANKVWRKLLGVESIVVEGIDIDEADGALVVAVRPMKRGLKAQGVRHPGT